MPLNAVGSSRKLEHKVDYMSSITFGKSRCRARDL